MSVDGQAKESDFIDELLRQLQKPIPGGDKTFAMGHADLHRLVREMVKAEVAGKKKDAAHDLTFSTYVSSILMKDF